MRGTPMFFWETSLNESKFNSNDLPASSQASSIFHPIFFRFCSKDLPSPGLPRCSDSSAAESPPKPTWRPGAEAHKNVDFVWKKCTYHLSEPSWASLYLSVLPIYIPIFLSSYLRYVMCNPRNSHLTWFNWALLSWWLSHRPQWKGGRKRSTELISPKNKTQRIYYGVPYYVISYYTFSMKHMTLKCIVLNHIKWYYGTIILNRIILCFIISYHIISAFWTLDWYNHKHDKQLFHLGLWIRAKIDVFQFTNKTVMSAQGCSQCNDEYNHRISKANHIFTYIYIYIF